MLTKTELKSLIDTFEVVGEMPQPAANLKCLFTDTMIWLLVRPLHFSLYYLGQILDLNKLFPEKLRH